MNFSEKYKLEIDNINPEEQLIEKTIKQIAEQRNKKKKRNLQDVIKMIITIISTITLSGGVVFAVAKVFNLDERFLQYFNINSEYANEIGVGSIEINETYQGKTGAVTLKQLLADSNNIYMIFEFKTINADQVETIKIYKGENKEENNLLTGEASPDFSADKSILYLNISGTDNLQEGDYLNIELETNQETLYLTTYVEKTVTEFTKNVNYQIKRNNGQEMTLNNLTITII